MTLPFGGDETLAERFYYEPDPERHDVPEEEFALAVADWRGTLAALDGDAGVSIYQRKELADDAFYDDFLDPTFYLREPPEDWDV